jgi:hypothetical protein
VCLSTFAVHLKTSSALPSASVDQKAFKYHLACEAQPQARRENQEGNERKSKQTKGEGKGQKRQKENGIEREKNRKKGNLLGQHIYKQ